MAASLAARSRAVADAAAAAARVLAGAPPPAISLALLRPEHLDRNSPCFAFLAAVIARVLVSSVMRRAVPDVPELGGGSHQNAATALRGLGREQDAARLLRAVEAIGFGPGDAGECVDGLLKPMASTARKIGRAHV